MRVAILSVILVTVVALTILFAYLISRYVREKPQPPTMPQAYRAYEKQRLDQMKSEVQMREILEKQRRLEEEMFNQWKENNQ